MASRNVAVTQQITNTISCDNLDEAIDHYTKHLGYRLDMVVPADAPNAAVLSKGSDVIRLEKAEPPALAGGFLSDHGSKKPPANEGGSAMENWVTGRAGMEYRDLIPGRMGGMVIASHIRITKGGEVPDYVHYHKVDFQMIYCKRGRIRVVYEDQGLPFWLETGDWVLQPPEIRHRVLECTAGAEVIEVSSPAEHETWVEHSISLPNDSVTPNRAFGGQRFIHDVCGSTVDGVRDTRAATGTNGLADLRIKREGGADRVLLLTFRGLGADRNSGLTTPISLEIPI
jgi:quercetin dioxygenase-like cupin family protein